MGLILTIGNGEMEEAVTMTGPGGGRWCRCGNRRGAALRARGRPQPAAAGAYSRLASASEIVSAALQDYRRAVLVGEKSTSGKGTVQTVAELDQYMPPALRQYKAGGLRLTIQKFYRVSGGSTQNRGVPPDIALPSLSDHLDMAESSLPNAMIYDQIHPAAYRPVDAVTAPELARLRAASAGRVAATPDFKFVRQDIALYLERKKEKTVSLNYARRLAERKEDEARKTRRNKERAARGIPPLSVTGITLQDIEAGKPLVLNSTAAMEVSLSSGPVKAASVPVLPVSSAAAEGGGYAKAPAAVDFVLEEAARVLSDLIVRPLGFRREKGAAVSPGSGKSPVSRNPDISGCGKHGRYPGPLIRRGWGGRPGSRSKPVFVLHGELAEMRKNFARPPVLMAL